jgi:quercetin dioxygenase-like cupin family protein
MAAIFNVDRDGTPFRMGDTQSKVLVSPDTGARHVTFIYIRFDPGAEFSQHKHDRSEDVFIVLEGSGWFKQGEDLSPIGKGDVVFVPVGETHGTVAGPQGMVVAACQGPPDEKLYRGERNQTLK